MPTGEICLKAAAAVALAQLYVGPKIHDGTEAKRVQRLLVDKSVAVCIACRVTEREMQQTRSGSSAAALRDVWSVDSDQAHPFL